jgi:hypothetical protein
MGTSVMSAESEESMIEPKAVQQCKDIVRATTWEGDIRVNITTIIGAGRILAKRVDELEKVQPHVTRRFGGGGLGKTLLPSLHPRSALFSASLLVRPSILALPRSQPMWSIGRQ